MKTLFTMGFSGSPFATMPFLGQEAPLSTETALSDKDKSDLYNQLVDTDGKLDVVTSWKKNHPNLAADLGSDAARFKQLEASAAALENAAQEMEKRTEAAEPAQASPEELGQTHTWMNTVNEMYVIVANHKGTHTAAAAVPAPAGAAPAVNPIVIGIGVVGLLTLMIVAIK